MFVDPEKAMVLNRKLLEAETAGVLDAVVEYLDYKLLKTGLTGRVVPVKGIN